MSSPAAFASEFWSDLKTAQLITGWQAGMKQFELAAALACSEGAVAGKVKRLRKAGVALAMRVPQRGHTNTRKVRR